MRKRARRSRPPRAPLRTSRSSSARWSASAKRPRRRSAPCRRRARRTSTEHRARRPPRPWDQPESRNPSGSAEQLQRRDRQGGGGRADGPLAVGREVRRVLEGQREALRLRLGELLRLRRADPEEHRRHAGMPVLAEVLRAHLPLERDHVLVSQGPPQDRREPRGQGLVVEGCARRPPRVHGDGGLARGAAASPFATRAMAASSCFCTSSLYERTVICSFTSSGMMLLLVPPWIEPTLTTAESWALISRETMVCRATTVLAASSTGSTVLCGLAPWPPRP